MRAIMHPMNKDKIYQRIGEFVVCFQFLEDQIRQIGWLLLDPARRMWPPQALRNLRAETLAKKVAKLYDEKLHLCRLPDEQERLVRFAELIRRFHELRQFRNRVLHSAFVEIKGRGEILALMRADARLITDPNTGDKSISQEVLTETSFNDVMSQMEELALNLGQHYLQLIHRLPTE
jgi:hypothetical protein